MSSGQKEYMKKSSWQALTVYCFLLSDYIVINAVLNVSELSVYSFNANGDGLDYFVSLARTHMFLPLLLVIMMSVICVLKDRTE